MSAPNPHVSVFHFSSNISKAKIRKYKLATERGMAPDIGATDQTKPGEKRSNGKKSTAPVTINDEKSQASSIELPPAKKPRLKLHVKPRTSDDSGHTIAVARSKRTSSLRFPFADEVLADSNKTGRRKVAESSSLSPPISVRSSTPIQELERPSTRADYGDLMSYYIAGGEDDSKEEETLKPQRRTKSLPAKHELPKQSAPKSSILKQPPAQPASKHRRRTESSLAPSGSGPPHSTDDASISRHPQPMAPPIVLPQPTIHFIDVQPQPKPSRPDNITEMIDKLQKLSRALTDFGGVPSLPESPPPETSSRGAASASSDTVDDFLAQCEGTSRIKDLKSRFENHRTCDIPLSYGIRFIQNALRSWAQQRLTHDVSQQIQVQQQQAAQSQANGRWPLGSNDATSQASFAFPQGPIRVNLADTPEGLAIAAFQAVVDSDCLQVNGLFPVELTRALRHLYVQIDHLINQGGHAQEPWTCMSYQSQITAHKIRVDKWKESHARAQEEMARQHQIAQQHMMMQMGLQTHPQQPTMNVAQTQHAHALELERRRSVQHAAQQPYISQHHLNPLQFEAQHTIGMNGHPHHVSAHGYGPSFPLDDVPAYGESMGSAFGVNGETFTAMSGIPSGLQKVGAGQVQLDKMKLYMPGFLPRSGQSMKFSFAPHNEAALRVFGSQAFPSTQHSTPVPTPEPSNVAPLQPSYSDETINEVEPSPRIETHPPPVVTESPNTTTTTTNNALPSKRPKPANTARQTKTSKPNAGRSTPVNAPSRGRRPSSRPRPKADLASPEEDTIHVAMKPPSGAVTASASPMSNEF